MPSMKTILTTIAITVVSLYAFDKLRPYLP